MLYNYPFKVKIISLIILLFQLSLTSQELFKDKSIDSSFFLYTNKYQEVVYSHLNKSTYIKGESIGFTSYIINKKTKKPSKISTNLYCTVTDADNKIIKRQLIKVENGFSNSVFKLDSIFTTGEYTFKAYTNWMLNFNQQNFYVEKFKVIDPEKNKFLEKTKNDSLIDAQFLPEGGHLVHNVINTIGVILKDKNGYGIPNVSGDIIHNNKDTITSFKVNKLGIGRFSFLPEKSKDYKIVISLNEKKEIFHFSQKIETTGIVLKTKQVKDNIYISLVTNKISLKNIVNKKYKVIIHNGSEISSLNFEFRDKLLLTKKVNFKDLNPGINIFTLFDENNNPISERLIFNYNGISFLKSTKVELQEKQDSLSIKLSYNSQSDYKLNNLSTSILPSNTKSYKKNNTIISQTLIQPYINGVVENSSYYFLNISKQKKYDLDNLLLTQGWSSYNWKEIFNFTPNYSNEFEQGISLKLNNIDKDNSIIVHGLSNKSSEILTLNEKSKSISATNFYPINDEILYLSGINKKGKLIKPSVYIQFTPSNIPLLNKKFESLKPKNNTYPIENYFDISFLNSLNNTQMLEEFVIKVNQKKEKIERIENKSFGKVHFLNDYEKEGMTLAQYINIKGGFRAMDDTSTGTFVITPIIKNTVDFGVNVPAIFLNNIQITNFTYFYNFYLDNVEYIEIDKLGFSAGVRGGAGVIRIFTKNNDYSKKSLKETTQKFNFPITFHKSKKFYVPKYKNYNNTFYKSYGVIDWFPRKQINKDGSVSFNIKKTSEKFTLFIEGISDSGTFIFEERVINLK
ncbi:hypothetical protein H9W90_12300 [Polaribacter pectinis]|uniref:TonB-dependent receptor plug domain-containing protein n=1 Tax=Polaribacter pectinis TaxID=2738844 RepID=A0A7G9L8L7_9FLAO|nr:hypothetical protein [Polaribacter pectinis]QNM84966.1 hypothetical protein H9W90_12300 [Polaribacter pectinis]